MGVRDKVKNWFLKNKLSAVSAIGIFVCATTALLVYDFFGHQLIEAMYQGRAATFLNSFITGQKYHTLENYLLWADIWIAKYALYALLLCLFLLAPVNWKLVVLSIAFFTLSVEGVLRGHSFYISYLDAHDSTRYADATLLHRYDPLLGWKLAASAEGDSISTKNGFRVKVKTNAKGLRDEEYSYEKREGTSRILLLGDSAVAGFEVNKEDLLDAQLERLLNSHGKFEVINGGVRGYGTDQSYLYFRNEGYQYSPDIVIYVFVDNDPENNVTIHTSKKKFGKSYFVLDDRGQLTLKGVPVPKAFEPFDKSLMSDELVEQYYNLGLIHRAANAKPTILQSVRQDLKRFYLERWIRSRFKQDSKPDYVRTYENRILSKLLDSMKNHAQSIDAKFLVYEFTNGVGSPPAVPTDLGRIANDLGIIYLNAFKEFFEISKGSTVFCFPYDGHWNRKGHELAAQSIYRHLIKLKWIPGTGDAKNIAIR